LIYFKKTPSYTIYTGLCL